MAYKTFDIVNNIAVCIHFNMSFILAKFIAKHIETDTISS